MAGVPHSAGTADERSLHCKGFCPVFARRPSSFVDSWDFVSEVRAAVARDSKTPCLHTSRQILMNHVPVEIGPFCDAIERLCCSFIIAHRFIVGHGSLHGVTLPRSWFISLARSPTLLDKNTSYLPNFVNSTFELLRRIDFQREVYNPRATDNHQFKHYGSSLGPLYASVCITRM